MAKLPFSLQLYSVRDALAANPDAVLSRVKEIGFSHVETAGTAGLTAGAFREALERAGLIAHSAHVPFEACEQDLAGTIAECVTLGAGWAVIPWLSPEEHPTADCWIARAKAMETFGFAFRDAGVQLCYHNHTHEFERAGESTIFDLIFQHSDPEALAVELDTGWAHYAGADPVAILKRYAGRTPMIHVKDVKRRAEGEAPVTTELGNGATPFASILKAAGETGVSWLVVEQDDSARDTLESARMNAAYMRVHVF